MSFIKNSKVKSQKGKVGKRKGLNPVRVKEQKISRPIRISKTSKISTAIRLLQNNRLGVDYGGVLAKHLSTQEGDGDQKYTSFDPEAMAVAASMVDLGTVYKFRLIHVIGGQSSSAGGVLSGYQNADPSGGAGSTWTAAEWASLITLFSEVRNVSFSIKINPYRNNLLLQSGALYVSGVLSSLAAAPTTADQCFDNADAKNYSIGTDSTRFGFSHTVKNTLSELSWAIVTTPNPGSYAGCPGAIQWFGNGFTASVAVIQYAVEGIYEFRSRI